MQTNVPFYEYPRPDMKRDSYFCLNGIWNLRIGTEESKILVPYPPESPLSGVGKRIEKDAVLIYSRLFSLPQGFEKERTLLHFGAVDQTAKVFLNGSFLGEHEGGYLPFSFDITDHLKKGENLLEVCATDPLSLDLPYGKQCRRPHGMWYTPVSGIWQTVWLESVPANAIKRVLVSVDLDSAHIEVQGGQEKKKLILWGDRFAREYTFFGDKISLSLPDGHLWTPEDPYLYRFAILSGDDRVESYFALRTVEVKKHRGQRVICLNGLPRYFHGVLDQGYFPEGIFLPKDPSGYEKDILAMKSCGFDLLRKHIKIEPSIFYYACDRLGMLVFQDHVNAGGYSFLRDTVLPTLGIKRHIRVHRSEKMKQAFLAQALSVQDHLRSHPSVLLYTVFNEGWGQFDADLCYQKLKKDDPTRLFDTTSGWFYEKESDVDSHHIYFKIPRLTVKKERPCILSEFGGYSLSVPDHSFAGKSRWGYRFFRDKASWEKAMLSLYEEGVLPLAKKGLCATVLTQLSDVEGEENGLLTYDRAVLKANAPAFSRMAQRIREAFDQFISGT